MGLASLICGLITLCMALFSATGLGVMGIALGIIGIILGALGRKDVDQHGMATAGLIISIIGLFINIIVLVACVGCLAALGLGAVAAGSAL